MRFLMYVGIGLLFAGLILPILGGIILENTKDCPTESEDMLEVVKCSFLRGLGQVLTIIPVPMIAVGVPLVAIALTMVLPYFIMNMVAEATGHDELFALIGSFIQLAIARFWTLPDYWGYLLTPLYQMTTTVYAAFGVSIEDWGKEMIVTAAYLLGGGFFIAALVLGIMAVIKFFNILRAMRSMGRERYAGSSFIGLVFIVFIALAFPSLVSYGLDLITTPLLGGPLEKVDLLQALIRGITTSMEMAAKYAAAGVS